MKNLSLTQKYLIAALNNKKNLSANSEKMVCLVAAGLMELQQQGCIQFEKKKVTLCKKLPQENNYLAPLYDYIAAKKEVKLSKLTDAFCFSLTEKRFQTYFEAVGDSLVPLGFATPCEKGVIHKKQGYIEDEKTVNCFIEQIRTELLLEESLEENTAALALLLEKSNVLKSHFSRQERAKMKKTLKQLLESPQGKMTTYMIDIVDACISASAIAAISK